MILHAVARTVNDTILTPMFKLGVFGPHYDSPEARCMLLSIQLQESGPKMLRRQVGGPAKGLWQFEQGGVRGVVNASPSHALALSLATACHTLPSAVDPATAIYNALPTNDLLAAGIARLNLWDDPPPLPRLGDEQGAWRCYTRVWRPGRPRPLDWSANYAASLAVVSGN